MEDEPVLRPSDRNFSAAYTASLPMDTLSAPALKYLAVTSKADHSWGMEKDKDKAHSVASILLVCLIPFH